MTFVDIAINVIINIVSQEGFSFFDGHNIITAIILFVLITVYIILSVIINNAGHTKTKSKRLQKAFRENGGYEYAVDEMKLCISNRDYKSARNIKKILDLVEK